MKSIYLYILKRVMDSKWNFLETAFSFVLNHNETFYQNMIQFPVTQEENQELDVCV